VATKKAYHHGNLRSALIEASLRLIQEKGVRALTLREIGSMVGVSRMAAYRHFADKSDLLGAISEAGFAAFADALKLARDNAPNSFPARLDAMALAYVRFAMEHQAYYEVMFSSPAEKKRLTREQCAAAESSFRILEDTIRDGKARGEVRAGCSTMLARAVWSLVHGISTLKLETDLSETGGGTKLVLFCSEMMKTGVLTLCTEQHSPRTTGQARRGQDL